MTVIEKAERCLPLGLRIRLKPVLGRLDRWLSGSSDAALAQRMALTAFVIRIASAAIAFFAQIVQARLLGEFDYGIFAFVWVLVVVFGNLSCLGFHTAVIRFLPIHNARGDTELVRGLNVMARLVALLAASLLAAIGFLVLTLFGERIADYWLVPAFLGLITLPMIALGDVLDGTARANGWAVTGLGPTFLLRPVLILALMVLSVQVGAPRNATTAMTAALAATYLTTIVQYLRVTLRLRHRLGRGGLRLDMRPWTRFALPLFLVDGIGFLLTNSDVVVVGLYLPPDQVAIYYAAAKTVALVQFVNFSVKAAAGPRMSAILATGTGQDLATFAAQAARWSFWPSLMVGLCVVAAGPLLLSLFGPAFVTGYPLMLILFAGILAKASIGPGEVLLNMAGRQSLCVALYAGILTLNVTLNILLIPRFGLTGAAGATAMAMGAEALLLHLAVRRTLGIVLFAFARPVSAPSLSSLRKEEGSW